jgi:hypothetical protein
VAAAEKFPLRRGKYEVANPEVRPIVAWQGHLICIRIWGPLLLSSSPMLHSQDHCVGPFVEVFTLVSVLMWNQNPWASPRTTLMSSGTE